MSAQQLQKCSIFSQYKVKDTTHKLEAGLDTCAHVYLTTHFSSTQTLCYKRVKNKHTELPYRIAMRPLILSIISRI